MLYQLLWETLILPSLDRHWERVWSIRKFGGWWNDEEKRKIIHDEKTGGEKEEITHEKKWVAIDEEQSKFTLASPFQDIWHMVTLKKASPGNPGQMVMKQVAGPSWATWDAVFSYYCLFGPDAMRTPQHLSLCMRFNGFQQMKLSQEGYIDTPLELFEKLKRMAMGIESLACLDKNINDGLRVVAVSCEGEALADCQNRDLNLAQGSADWKWVSGTAKREINRRIDRFYSKLKNTPGLNTHKNYIDKFPDTELTPEIEINRSPPTQQEEINSTLRKATGLSTLSSDLFALKQEVPNEIITPFEVQSEDQQKAQIELVEKYKDSSYVKVYDVEQGWTLPLDDSKGELRPVDGNNGGDGGGCDISVGSSIGGGSISQSSTGSLSSTLSISSGGSRTEESLCEGDGTIRSDGGDSLRAELTESDQSAESLAEDNLD